MTWKQMLVLNLMLLFHTQIVGFFVNRLAFDASDAEKHFLDLQSYLITHL